MAQLKDTVVQGSLRVTDTIYGNQVKISDKIVTPEIYSTGDIYIRTSWDGGSTKTTVAKFSGAQLLPGTSDTNRSIGSSSVPWPNIYATTFTGNLTGTASNVTTTAANATAFIPVGVTSSVTTTLLRATQHSIEQYRYTINDATNGGQKPAFKLAGKDYSILFMIGDGNTNRGIYQSQPSDAAKWLLYWDTSNAHFNTGVNIDDSTASNSISTGALVVDGGVGIAKNLHIGKGITIDNEEAIFHLKFTRSNYNYILIPSGSELDIIAGSAAAVAGGMRIGITVSGNNMTSGYISPGVTNVADLGSSSLKWKNVYATTLNGALAASNITGTLGVNHGGTGITTTDPHKVLIGPATGAAAAPTWREPLTSDIQPQLAKTYPAYTCSANDANNGNIYFGKINITPISTNPDTWRWQAPWVIRYRLYVETTEASVQGWYDCYFSISGSVVNYYNCNNFYSTDFRPIYHHRIIYPKDTYSSYGGYIGARIQSAYSPNTLARTYRIEILETKNCTVELFDNIKKQSEVYITTNGNAADVIWYVTDFGATSRGLQETGDANDNNTASGYIRDYGDTQTTIKIINNILYPYSIILPKGNGLEYYPINNTSKSTAVTKTTIFNGEFNIIEPLYYYPTDANVAVNGQVRQDRLWLMYPFNLSYSFNTGTTLTKGKDVYMVATLQSATTAKLRNPTATNADASAQATGANAGPITQTLPNTDDGFIYIRLGRAYSTSAITMSFQHIIYWFKDGEIREYDPTHTIADTTNTLYPVGVTAASPSILKRNTSITITGGDLRVGNTATGQIWAGTHTYGNPGTGHRYVGVANGAGLLYFYSHGPVDGDKGIFAYSGDGQTGTNVIKLDQAGKINAFATLACNLTLIPATDTGIQIAFGQNNTNRWGLCSDASSNSTNFRIYSYNSNRSMIECYHNGVIRVRHNLLAIPTADQEAEIGVYTNAEGTNKLYLYRQPTASQTNSGLYCNGLDNENNTIGSILYNDAVTNRYSGQLEWLQLGHWYDEMLRIKSRHPWPYIRFDSVASTTSNPTYNTYNLNLLGQLVFQNYIKKKDNSEAYGATFFFRTYSVNSSNNTKTNYYEDFSLPNVPNNLTASATYDIITGKGGNLRANLYRLVDVSRAVAPSAHTYAAYEYISSTNRARLAIMEYMKAQEGYQRLNFYLLADTASANNYGGLYIRGNYQDATANVCGFNISTGIFTAPKVYNAVWNDYAECRKASTSEPGRVITESTFGTMQLASERLMPGCKIISDTYGTLMGESDEAKTPIAVAGRVLVYPYKDKKYYHLGDAVCSAPNGTIDIMSREEIMMFPERIIGTVSEIPAYEEWQAGAKENPISIKVNGRIWIYVK